MWCSVECRSQDQIKTIKKLDDGSIALEVNGLPMLAITPAQLKEWQKLQGRLDDSEAKNAEKEIQITKLENEKTLLVKDVASAETQRDSAVEDAARARDDAKRYLGLSIKLDTLLTESRQFIPHGEVKGFWGKVVKVLDHPAFQATWKLVPPTYQMMRCQ